MMAKPTPMSQPARRYRPRRLQLANGEQLELGRDGTIAHHDPAGAVTRTWGPHDAEWPQHAIRFGLRETPRTVKPSGRDTPASKPG
jgi:hypothetical protein